MKGSALRGAKIGSVLAVLLIVAVIQAVRPLQAQDCMRYENFPHQVSFMPMYKVMNVLIDGDLLYVAAASPGSVKIVDVTDRTNPVLLSSVGTRKAQDVVRIGEMLYVADSDTGIVVMNLTDPAHPAIVTKVRPGGDSRAIAVSSGVAYVAAGSAGIHVLDTTDPANPLLIGTVPTAGVANQVQIDGDHLFVCAESAGLQIFSLADPFLPQWQGSVATPLPCLAVAVRGKLAYVGGGGSLNGFLAIVNISDPMTPTLQQYQAFSGIVHDIVNDDRFLYLARHNYGLEIFSLSNPENPQIVGCTDVSSTTVALAVDDRFAYRANVHGGIDIVELGNRMNPPTMAQFDLDCGAMNLLRHGDTVFISSSYDSPATIYGFDVSVPTAPELISRLEWSWWWITAMDNSQNLLVVGDQWTDDYQSYGRFRIVDIGDPGIPILLSSVETMGSCEDVAIFGHDLYIADGRGGLLVVDISDPEHPVSNGCLDTNATYMVEISGNLLFVTNSAGLTIYLPLDSGEPLELGTIPDFHCDDVVVNGTVAYANAGGNGVAVLDLSNPMLPSIISYEGHAYQVRELSLRGGMLYAATYHPGMVIYDASEITSLDYIGLFGSRIGISAVTAGDEYLYCASSGADLVIALPECAAITAVPSGESPPSVGSGPSLTCHPNPFNPLTTIKFDVPVDGQTTLRVYDIRGALVRTLVDADLPRGNHQATWDGRDASGRGMASGSYFARLGAGGRVETMRLSLIR